MATADFEVVTPEIAEEYLKLNTSNFRKLDKRRVARYAKEMASGNWKCNGESLKFNGSALEDGQHRLHAIIQSGVAIKTLVVRGLDCGCDTIDRGQPRTVGQILANHGCKDPNNVAAIAKLAVLHEKGRWSLEGIAADVVVDSEIIDFALQFDFEIKQAVKLARPARHVLPLSLLSTVLFCGCGKKDAASNEMCCWFAEALAKGGDLSDTEAVLHLRNRMLAQSPQNRIPVAMKRALTTLAWNKSVRGESCSSSGLRIRLSGPNKQKMPSQILVASEVTQ